MASTSLVGLRLHIASYTSLSMVSTLGFLTLEVGIEGLLEIFISGLVKVTGDGAFWNVLGFLMLFSC